jgi:hypothetical protein
VGAEAIVERKATVLELLCSDERAICFQLNTSMCDLCSKELSECLFWFFVCSRSYVWEHQYTAYSLIAVIFGFRHYIL